MVKDHKSNHFVRARIDYSCLAVYLVEYASDDGWVPANAAGGNLGSSTDAHPAGPSL